MPNNPISQSPYQSPRKVAELIAWVKDAMPSRGVLDITSLTVNNLRVELPTDPSTVVVRRFSATGRAQLVFGDESHTGFVQGGAGEMWRFGMTAGGSSTFHFFDETANVLSMVRGAAGAITFASDRPVTMGVVTMGNTSQVSGGAGAQFYISGGAGNVRDVVLATAGSARWILRANSGAESGSNAGSDFELQRRDDAGASLGVVLSVVRSTGAVSFGSLPVSMGALTATTITGSDLLQITRTSEQARFRYDTSNYLSITVSSAGAVTFNATGASAGHTFSEGVEVSGGLGVGVAAPTTSGRIRTAAGGAVGLGTSPTDYDGLAMALALNDDGVGNAAGIENLPLFQSDVTAEARGLYQRLRTAAAAFTITEAKAIRIANAELGASSAITTLYGLYIDALTAGGTNYAIYTNGGIVRIGSEIRIGGDVGGASSHTTLTNTVDLAARNTGVGTILFNDATNRNSVGFIKFYIGTTAYYVPVFDAI